MSVGRLNSPSPAGGCGPMRGSPSASHGIIGPHRSAYSEFFILLMRGASIALAAYVSSADWSPNPRRTRSVSPNLLCDAHPLEGCRWSAWPTQYERIWAERRIRRRFRGPFMLFAAVETGAATDGQRGTLFLPVGTTFPALYNGAALDSEAFRSHKIPGRHGSTACDEIRQARPQDVAQQPEPAATAQGQSAPGDRDTAYARFVKAGTNFPDRLAGVHAFDGAVAILAQRWKG